MHAARQDTICYVTLHKTYEGVPSAPNLTAETRATGMASYQLLGSCDEASRERRRGQGTDTQLQDSSGDADINPFAVYPPFTKWDYVKMTVNALWLVPLRLFLLVFPATILGAVSTAIITLCERFNEDDPHPLRGWRKFYLQRICPKISRLFLFGFGFHWIHTKGEPADSTEAPIFVAAPHSSLLDTFVISLYHIPTVVARADTRRVPFFGWVITRTLRTIYVSREDSSSRMKAVQEIRRRAQSRGEWPKVLIYPEGTTTNTKVLLKFKHGAFSPTLPVQPVLINYQNRLNTMVWGEEGLGLVRGLFLTLCQFHNSLEVKFMPPYHPSTEEKEDHKLYAENVRRKMGETIGIPVTGHALEDFFLMRVARSVGLPPSSGIVMFGTAQKKLGMDFAEIKRRLRRFAVMDRDKDGYITAEDLAHYLNVPSDACLHAVFSAINRAEDGKLSFRNYLYGVVNLTQPLLENTQFLQSMFSFFDQDGDGVVRKEDLSRLPLHSLPTPPPEHRENSRASYQNSSTIPTEMNFDDFKSVLASNPEYLAIFDECQNAGISSPPPQVDGTALHTHIHLEG